MGRVEEVTLPTRFILTAAHLIATLTIVYDVVRATLYLAMRPLSPPPLTHHDPNTLALNLARRHTFIYLFSKIKIKSKSNGDCLSDPPRP